MYAEQEEIRILMFNGSFNEKNVLYFHLSLFGLFVNESASFSERWLLQLFTSRSNLLNVPLFHKQIY